MANTIRDYSATAASNTVVDGADISEGCSPAGINNAIRGVMADLKDVSTGAVALESPAADSLTVTGNVGAATFSGDGSALTGIPTPTLTSLGIANHDQVTVTAGGAVTATSFSGDGSALTGITIPTLSSLGIANHDQVTVTAGGAVTATSFSGDGSSLTGISAGATGGGNDEIFYENGQTVTTNYTITNGKNAMSAGPITINAGVTVTVGTGETWTVV